MASPDQGAQVRTSVSGAVGVDRSAGSLRSATLASAIASSTLRVNVLGKNGDRKRAEAKHRVVGGRWLQFAYACMDIICVLVSGGVALYAQFSSVELHAFRIAGHLGLANNQPVSHNAAFLLLYVALILLFCGSQDLYRTLRTRSALEESAAVAKAVVFATLLFAAFIYLSGAMIVSRPAILAILLTNTAMLVSWRYAKRKIVIRRVEQGIGARNVAIVGSGEVGLALAKHIQENKLLGYCFKGFLDENHSGEAWMLGRIEDLPRVARSEFLDDVFITPPFEREMVKRLAIAGQEHRLSVKVIPELYDGLGCRAPIHHIGEFPVMDLHWQPVPSLGFFAKRVFDIVASAVGLVVSAPLLLAAALWIKLDSPGAVFYSSPRVGKKGRTFRCHKLRTMVANADELKDSLRCQNERQGPFFKIAGDPRISRAGRILRKYSIDELPQLWNVLRGEMSLVGPRPHPLDDFQKYDLDHFRRLEMKPGITGLWQVLAREDPSFDTNMELDRQYIENWHLWLDVKILAKTFSVVAKGTGR